MFVKLCLHTNKRRPCSSTLSGHPSSSSKTASVKGLQSFQKGFTKKSALSRSFKVAAMETAARQLAAMGPRWVLVKGGNRISGVDPRAEVLAWFLKSSNDSNDFEIGGSPTHTQRKIDRDYVLDAGSANSHFLFLYTSTVAHWIWLWFDFAEQIQTFQFLFSSVFSCVFLPQLSTNRSQVDICLVWHWVGRDILRKHLIAGSWGCRHM